MWTLHWVLFQQNFGKIGPLFIPLSGHSACAVRIYLIWGTATGPASLSRLHFEEIRLWRGLSEQGVGRRAWGRVSRGGHLEVAHRPDGRLLSLLLQDELLEVSLHLRTRHSALFLPTLRLKPPPPSSSSSSKSKVWTNKEKMKWNDFRFDWSEWVSIIQTIGRRRIQSIHQSNWEYKFEWHVCEEATFYLFICGRHDQCGRIGRFLKVIFGDKFPSKCCPKIWRLLSFFKKQNFFN